jgi:hypothetical protein
MLRNLSGRIRLQVEEEPVTDARNAEGARVTTLLIPKPPEATGKLA